MSLIPRTSALATLTLGALLALGACSDASTAPDVSARMATTPVVPVVPIKYVYTVDLKPCAARNGACANASVTGTVKVDPNTNTTPPNVTLNTAMWWAPGPPAVPGLPPAGSLPVPVPAIGPASVQLPAAVGQSSKTVQWAAVAAGALPIPAAMTHICLRGDILVNNVSRASKFDCFKL